MKIRNVHDREEEGSDAPFVGPRAFSRTKALRALLRRLRRPLRVERNVSYLTKYRLSMKYLLGGTIPVVSSVRVRMTTMTVLASTKTLSASTGNQKEKTAYCSP